MSWFMRLKDGLSRSSDQIKGQLADVLGKAKLESDDLEKIEEALILADMGPGPAAEIAAAMAARRFGKGLTEEALMGALADEIAEILRPMALPLDIESAGLHTVLVIGVNGSGKTTTIAKLAERYCAEGKKVVLAAGDTFRAAAVEQLKTWGERIGVEVLSTSPGGDAAGLVFDAVSHAELHGADLLLIDTAGRLQNKHNLMEELVKIARVMGKKHPGAPHHVLLVLDGGGGQNALEQVRVFHEALSVTGLVVTKLDGTARAGVLVALARKYGLPVCALGVGERAEDLQNFDATAFARALVGLAER